MRILCVRGDLRYGVKLIKMMLLSFVWVTPGCLTIPALKDNANRIPSFDLSDAAVGVNLESNSEEANLRKLILSEIKRYSEKVEQGKDLRNSLNRLAQLYMLAGDAISMSKKEKKNAFLRTIEFSEKAMYTNPGFKHLIDSGESVWEASRVLTVTDMDSMIFWTNGIFYYFKDVLNTPGKVLNSNWLKRAKVMLDRMTEIDPDYEGGKVSMILAIYYLALPESIGGDLDRAKQLFEKAVRQADGDYLLNRWLRARYYHVRMNHPDQFEEDLNWVLRQDSGQFKDEDLWKLYIIQNSRALLESKDMLF
jgi:tetratricopeptide (TPR) repeat protein